MLSVIPAFNLYSSGINLAALTTGCVISDSVPPKLGEGLIISVERTTFLASLNPPLTLNETTPSKNFFLKSLEAVWKYGSSCSPG